MKKILFFIFIFTTSLVFSQQDCTTAIPICSDADINQLPNGFGTVEEAETGGCLSGESNSFWFTFSVQNAGTLTFLITPNGPNAQNIDYDFALYGPNHDCANVNAVPLRCSYAGLGSPLAPETGLNMTSTDTTEGGGGDGFVKYIDVLPGQVYYLLLNNFSTTVAPFSLTFGGTAALLTPFDNNSAQFYQPFPFLRPGALQNGEIDICGDPVLFDFSTLTPSIINNNPNFIVKYYATNTDAIDDINPIVNPVNVNTTTTYHYAISYVDPTKPLSFLNQCREFNTFTFKDRSFQIDDATLTACSNNNSGTATYDLTTATINSTPNLVLKYYPSLFDLNNGTNEITIPQQFTTPATTVYVKATNEYGCTDIAAIKLDFLPLVIPMDASIRNCAIEATPLLATFNLTIPAVTLQTGITKTYFPSLTDAINNTNEILNPTAYVAPNGNVYVRLTNGDGCYAVAKITLSVIPPLYSSVLADQIACIEGVATLDAGPGFDAYEWSNGATTQSITNATVGTYWVKLTKGECVSTQYVKVYASEQPVITGVDITNNNIVINVIGGTPAYQYSLDNFTWQDSNSFNSLVRGDYTIYVKDAYDCVPVQLNIVVPNFNNVITPNGDGINDGLDYSGLANKKNFVMNIFDRYGSKIYQIDKNTNYKWNGTNRTGKKITSGNYWYSVTWNENDSNATPIKFSGWIMVKNRD